MHNIVYRTSIRNAVIMYSWTIDTTQLQGQIVGSGVTLKGVVYLVHVRKQKQLYTSIPFEDHVLEVQKGVVDIQFQELHQSHKS